MSFNPARMVQTGQAPIRQRRLEPGSGIRHSSLLDKNGPQGITPSDIAKRVPTESGWRVTQFKGQDFEIIYEFMCARNSTGLMVHREKSRSVRVLSGELYAHVDKVQFRVGKDEVVNFDMNVPYMMASSGTFDVELLIVQSAGYDEALELIDPDAKVCNTETTMILPTEQESLTRVPSTAGMKAAEKMKKKRELLDKTRTAGMMGDEFKVVDEDGEVVVRKTRRVKPGFTAANTVGVNPRPLTDAELLAQE